MAVGTASDIETTVEPLTPAEQRELLTTMRRVDALLTEFEPTLRAMANNPVAKFAAARHNRKG